MINKSFKYKYLKHTPNKIALFFILLIFALSLFGHLIIKDKSENANLQNLELRLQKPNTTIYSSTFESKFIFFIKKINTNKAIKLSSDTINIDSKQKIYTHNYLLGTDSLGRDILSRLILGSKTSIFISLIATLFSLLIGLCFGILSGYYGGWVDRFTMWTMNLFWSIPAILLAMSLTNSLNQNDKNTYLIVIISISVTMWVETARMIRAVTISLLKKEFLLATTALGFNDFRVILNHIFPNIFVYLIALFSSNFSSALMMESGLSFLGLGIQPPVPSWGSMLREYFNFIGTPFFYYIFFSWHVYYSMCSSFQLFIVFASRCF